MSDVTQILNDWRGGDISALGRLIPLSTMICADWRTRWLLDEVRPQRKEQALFTTST